MKTGRFAAAVALSLLTGIALAPTADAFGGRGGRAGGGGFRGRPMGFQPTGFNHGFKGVPPGFNHGFKGFPPGFNGVRQPFNAFNPGGYNRSFPGMDTPGPGFLGFRGFNRFKGQGGFDGFGVFAPWGTTTVYTAPLDYSDSYGYAAPTTPYVPQYPAPAYLPPAPYAPPVGGSISITPPPPTTVVSFPGGRYELRGDGIDMPFQWVWVPTGLPPVPPPPTAPPAAAEKNPGEPSPSADDAPARRSQLYRWTDEQGIVHWTNRANAVPPKYRTQAKYTPSY